MTHYAEIRHATLERWAREAISDSLVADVLKCLCDSVLYRNGYTKEENPSGRVTPAELAEIMAEEELDWLLRDPDYDHQLHAFTADSARSYELTLQFQQDRSWVDENQRRSR